MYVVTIVLKQPNNVTVCEGNKEAVFTCVLNTTNANINSDNVQWYRSLEDIGNAERVNQNSNIHLTTSTTNNTLTSSLTITNAVKSYTGYYWVRLPSGDVCNVSLTVFGTSM